MTRTHGSGWPERRLGDLVAFDLRQVDPLELPPQTPYVGLEDVRSDGTISGSLSVGEAQVRSSKFPFADRHVLFGKLRPYLRKIARPGFPGVCSTDILPILPGPNLDKDYLYHWLRQPTVVAMATARSKGANLPRLAPRTLAEFSLILPPLSDQRRIAAMLDKADEIRRKRQERVGLLDHLLGSAFLEMFGDPVRNERGWESCPLDRVAAVASGLTKGRRLRGDVPVESVPYLRVANVQDGRIDVSDVRTIEATSTEIERSRLVAGDVLVTEGGDPDKLGRGAVWAGQVAPCTHQNHIFRIRMTSPSVLPEYLSALMGSTYGKRYFLRSAKQTTGIASINRTQLGQFPVLLPPLDLQQHFVRLLEGIRRNRGLSEGAGGDADSLLSSLSGRAFG